MWLTQYVSCIFCCDLYFWLSEILWRHTSALLWPWERKGEKNDKKVKRTDIQGKYLGYLRVTTQPICTVYIYIWKENQNKQTKTGIMKKNTKNKRTGIQRQSDSRGDEKDMKEKLWGRKWRIGRKQKSDTKRSWIQTRRLTSNCMQRERERTDTYTAVPNATSVSSCDLLYQASDNKETQT